MRRMSAALVGAVLTLGGVALVHAGLASAAPSAPSVPSVVQQSQALHSDVMNLLNGYVRTYSPDLSASDRSRVNELVTNANRSLGRLEAAVTAISQAKTASAHRAAVATALARYSEAKSAATSGIAQVTPLLTARMNVFELLSAKRDADRLMTRLDELGSALRTA